MSANEDTRHVVAARFLFSTKQDADRAAVRLDALALDGLLAVELTIEEV